MLTGRGIGRHENVIRFCREIIRQVPELDEEHVRAVHILHSNFYHDFLEPEIFDEYVKLAGELYDCLHLRLSKELQHRTT